MSSDKKGFSGLYDLVSDISDDLPPQLARKPAQLETAPRPESESEQRPVPPQSNVSPPAQPGSSHSTQSSLGGGGTWVIAIVVMFVLLIVVLVSSRRNDGASSQALNSTQSIPTPSVYAVGIPDISSDQDRFVNALLQGSQDNDATAIGNAASALKALSSKPNIEKAAYKDSRAMNKKGLQHHREGHNDLAAKEFFAAYRLNSFDPEIADNLGYVLYIVGDYAAAQKAYLAALIHSARRASAWGGLAKVYAVNNIPDKAGNAFALAFLFSKSPKTLRQTLLASYREEKTPTVKNAFGAALAANYSAAVAKSLKAAMGNLANVEIPIFLPTQFSPLDFEGKPITAFLLNNGTFGIQASTDSYQIPFGSEVDCVAIMCGIGFISARRVQPTDLEDGETVELEGGIKGVIVKGSYRDTDDLVFRIGDVRYSFNLGSAPAANVEAANSALRLGAIPNDILGILPKMALTSQPLESARQYTIVPPQIETPAPLPAPGYTRPPANPYCSTTYDISLETFGEGVTVELRKGYPGNSTEVDIAHSSGGNVRFSRICAGSYFLAIGNADSVSVTPVKNFEHNMEYSSNIRMQRGSGNVITKRRSEL